MIDNKKQKATLIGCIAIGLWGFLAYFTKLTDATIPPFQMVSMTFSIGALLMALRWWVKGINGLSFIRQPILAWMLSVGGLFGYHFCYFLAMQLAPAVEVSLIAYLWPLFIVLLSSFLPGERLLINHLIGAVIAFIGCWVLIAQKADGFDLAYLPGYLVALGCAFIWSTYSVLNRLVAQVPTDAVAWFMLLAAVLSLICHIVLEETVWPSTLRQWMGVIALGIGPLGIAFFTWDYGTKHGDIQLLGVLSYFAPLISVIVLVIAGMAEPSARIWLACIAIITGSLIAGINQGRNKLKTD